VERLLAAARFRDQPRESPATERTHMSERELIEPHKGDKRYQRRNADGTFGDSDDQSKSLSQDAKRKSATSKPKNQGDKGD
jgi:hypothetical protein